MRRTGHGNIWGKRETKEKTTKNVPSGSLISIGQLLYKTPRKK